MIIAVFFMAGFWQIKKSTNKMLIIGVNTEPIRYKKLVILSIGYRREATVLNIVTIIAIIV